MTEANILVKLKADDYADLLIARAELLWVLVGVPFPVGKCIFFASVVEEIVISITVVMVLNSA